MKTTRGKILTFANPKGGVGKSTLSCLITAMLEWSNKYEMVQLIDADKQGSSVSLLQRICRNVACSHYPISYEYDKLNLILLYNSIRRLLFQSVQTPGPTAFISHTVRTKSKFNFSIVLIFFVLFSIIFLSFKSYLNAVSLR